MISHNTCFHGEIRKTTTLGLKKSFSLSYIYLLFYFTRDLYSVCSLRLAKLNEEMKESDDYLGSNPGK